MPDLKYLYRVLYILINCFFKQIVDIFFNKDYYQESNILITAYSNVVTVAEWLDGSFESQIRLVYAQQWFHTRNSHNMNYKFLSLKQ
jgi:hypothetical protein